jgi:hypothetical protein
VLGELRNYSSRINWTFIEFNARDFEKQTGLTKEWNNPAVTNNIGFKYAKGRFICQQGNEVIAWDNVYDKLLENRPTDTDYWLCVSTTFDMPAEYLERLDQYGSNLMSRYVVECSKWPLQSQYYRSDVTNYISIASRELWEKLEGYDERYYQGISAEDSDFVRRARTLPGFRMVVSDGISLHQFHSGKTRYYDPPQSVITQDRWNKLVQINHNIYNAWDGNFKNPQQWPFGTIGISKITSNWR